MGNNWSQGESLTTSVVTTGLNSPTTGMNSVTSGAQVVTTSENTVTTENAQSEESAASSLLLDILVVFILFCLEAF